MKRWLLISLLVIESLFGIDAELDVVRKNTIIPAIGVIVSKNGLDETLGNKIKNVLEKDFSVSGHFNVLGTEMIQENLNTESDFSNPLLSKFDLLVSLEIKNTLNGTLSVGVSLFDVNTKMLKSKNTYQVSRGARYPFLAHKIAIAVNQELKAPSIDWMDRFILFSRYTSSKKSEIVISDYTLTYQQVIVSGGLNIFPKWANKEQTSFYYTTYDNLYPTLVKQDLYNRKSERILQSDGMLVCSDVSNDGNKLLLTLAPNGQPDIYLYDLKSKEKTRITKYSGIDVGGNFLANEDKIVFVSDRLGQANIFSQKIGTDIVNRLVYHGKNNSQATTFNNYVVYSSREEGKNGFNLYLISTDNDGIKKLTTQGANQFPKFSVDGESILYVNNTNGISSLGIARLSYDKNFLFSLKSGKIQSIDW